MKTLPLDHTLAEFVLKGDKSSIWRFFDDQDLRVDDEAILIDKVDAQDSKTWRSIGIAKITKVIEKHLRDITEQDVSNDEQLSSPEQMLEMYRRYYGATISLDTPVKILFFRFTPLNGDQEKNTSLSHVERAVIYADGASRGNPGPSAAGYVIYDDQHVLLRTKGSYLGVTTNNQAEYVALKLALDEVRQMGAYDVAVYMDSLLVINQMEGRFKVTNRDLWPIHDAVKGICKQFQHVTFTQIPRELNRLADSAANEVLDAQQAAAVAQ